MRLRFDEYQERCLYDPEHGFFVTRPGAGTRGGDFLTSPEVGPLFGAVLARWLDAVWVELGEPAAFDVVEVGAGRGALAAAIHRAAPRCAPALRHVLVERSAALRARAEELLGDRATVTSALPERASGVIVANELLDNIPARIVTRTPRGWSEVFVEITDTGAVEVLEPCDGDPALPAEALDIPAGTRLPLVEQAASWVDGALGRLEAGRLLCLDYGVRSTVELAERRWLRTYAGHERGADPYESPMEQDITIDVPMDQLPGGPSISTQADFLRGWGIDELVEEGRQLWEERAHVGDLAAIAARSRINEAAALLDPDGLGAFLVAEWIVP